MPGITIIIKKDNGMQVEAIPYGIQFTAEGTFMTARVGDEIIRVDPPKGLMFSSNRGWHLA